MKRSHKAAGVLAALTLGVAAVAFAHPGQGQMGGDNGHAMEGGMGMHGRTGMHQGMHEAGPQVMTPEERSAMREKMRAAKTPEERQNLAEANRAEMQKRAKERATPGSDTHTH